MAGRSASYRTESSTGYQMIWIIITVRPPRNAEYISTPIGLELARLADLPEEVLTEGRKMAEKLAALHAKDQGASESGKISARRKALLRVNLRILKVFFLGLKGSATAPDAARTGTGTLNLAGRGFVGVHQANSKGHCACTLAEHVIRLYINFFNVE